MSDRIIDGLVVQNKSVEFHVWNTLKYPARMGIALGLISVGLLLQIVFYNFYVGLIFLVAGNVLLLSKGYHNLKDKGSFSAEATWQKADRSKIDEIKEHVKKIKKWDKASVDISNIRGILQLLALLLVAVIVMIAGGRYGYSFDENPRVFLAFDLLILLLPHWFSGMRQIDAVPNLMFKLNFFDEVFEKADSLIQSYPPEFHVLLKQGETTKLPTDLKVRFDLHCKNPEFLGMYAQIVVNTVQSEQFPYLYVVLVAKKSFGLRSYFHSFEVPKGVSREFKEQKEVDVLIIRQHTTKTSGYHTKPKKAKSILATGIGVLQQME